MEPEPDRFNPSQVNIAPAKSGATPPRPPNLVLIGVLLALLTTIGGALWFTLAGVNSGGSNLLQPSPTPVPGSGNQPTSTAIIASSGTFNPAQPKPASSVKVYGVVVSKQLNLRAEASADAPVTANYKLGDVVELVSRNGGWYQTAAGGWLSALYLEVRQTRPEAEYYARELTNS